jgi:prepilin-type N-terminal cleavage/methylation domain-containing protein
MNTRRQGFTIIETVLVLAITGLLLAVILATIGNSLNQQRYTDSVNQTLDHFRGLYTDTSSTQMTALQRRHVLLPDSAR